MPTSARSRPWRGRSGSARRHPCYAEIQALVSAIDASHGRSGSQPDVGWGTSPAGSPRQSCYACGDCPAPGEPLTAPSASVAGSTGRAGLALGPGARSSRSRRSAERGLFRPPSTPWPTAWCTPAARRADRDRGVARNDGRRIESMHQLAAYDCSSRAARPVIAAGAWPGSPAAIGRLYQRRAWPALPCRSSGTIVGSGCGRMGCARGPVPLDDRDQRGELVPGRGRIQEDDRFFSPNAPGRQEDDLWTQPGDG